MMQKRFTDHTVIKVALLLLLAGSVHANVTGSLNKDSGWYPAGTNITVTADPGLYSRLDRWEGSVSVEEVAGDQVTFVVDGSRSITAVFAPEVTVAGSVPLYWLASINTAWTNDFEAAATNDVDGDGFTTEQEYWAGTDPTNPDSYLHISAVERSGDGVRLVSSHARVDSRIPPLHIEGRASLVNGSWMPLVEKLPVDGVNGWDIPADENRFFRLRVNTP